MAADFNPYHVWLGIPPEDQPANYYRLLSLKQFETNGDVIDSAADRQSAHLRTFQGGKHGELTQRLLNEVSAARVCLLDAKKRATYDQQLRANLATAALAAPAASAALPAAGGSAILRQPPRRPADAMAFAPAVSIPLSAALPKPFDPWEDLLGNPTDEQVLRPGGKPAGATTAKEKAIKQRAANSRKISIGIAALVVLVAAVGIGVFALNSPSDGTLLFDWPLADRLDTTITVDGAPLPAPASGPWEYHGPAGSHRIVAEHLAYKLDANVAVVAGQQQSVPSDWKPKATLALDWPVALHSGAELKVDGRTHSVTQLDPIELAVEPGPHVVRVTLQGSTPIVRTTTIAVGGRQLVSIRPPPPASTKLDLPAGENQPLTPKWTPEHEAAPTVVVNTPAPPVERIPLNQWVDVLRLVDTARDRVNGTWSSQGSELSCKSAFASRVELPVSIDGGYDFAVEFTRTSGNDIVAAVLSVASHECIVGLSGWSGSVSGLMNVDGHEALDTKNPITVRPGSLENGRRYRLLTSVRILDNGRASVDVSLDGKPYLPHWEGDPAVLSAHWAWKMPHSDRLGLGATYSAVTFHSAQLRMVSGRASIDSAGGADAKPAPATAAGEAPASLKGRFFVACKGEAELFINGRPLPISDSASESVRISKGDVVALRISSKFVHRTARAAFLSDDRKWKWPFHRADLSVFGDADPASIDPSQFTASLPQAGHGKANDTIEAIWARLELPSESEWIWSGGKNAKTTVAALVSPALFVPNHAEGVSSQ